MVLAFIGVALAAPIAAQTVSKLDGPIRGEFRIDDPRSLHSCASGVAVDQLARAANVLVGFETTRDCRPSPRVRTAGASSETMTGMSVREAFDHLIASMPMYSWKELNGVVVVRPKTAWADPDDLLNQPVQPFEVTNERADDVLHTVLRAVTPSLFLPHEDVPRSGQLVDHSMTVTFPGGTLLDAFNTIVGAHGSAQWQVGYVDGRAMVYLGTLVFPGDSVMAPAALPQPHR
jgi:hypothetical protein